MRMTNCMSAIMLVALGLAQMSTAAAQSAAKLKKYATLKSGLGDSYCLVEHDGKRYPVRQLTYDAAFETHSDVDMIFRTEQDLGAPCPGIEVVKSKDKMRIRRLGGKLHLQFDPTGKFEQLERDVVLDPPFPSSDQVFWLTGSDGHFDYFVYLLDTPQALSEIYKLYRVTIFDASVQSCKDAEPKVASGIFAKWSDEFRCNDQDITKQSQGGNGYEPPR